MFALSSLALAALSLFAAGPAPFATPLNEAAPVRCEQSIRIHATPARVWAVLAAIDRWPAWQPGVRTAQLGGPLQPGTPFSWKAGGTGIRAVLHTVVPGRYLGWTGQAYGTRAVHNWTLTRHGDETEVAVAESMQGLLAHVLKKALNRMLANDMDESLRLLKVACEKP